MKRHWSIFWSPGFILGLILLLLNDHYLKSAFHNSFTGKLSDFAGLFIFPMFFAVLFPKFPKHVYWITAIGFIFWKLPFSGFFIETWNSIGIFSIQRVVDYSDLLALLILPFSFLYFEKQKSIQYRFTPIPIMIVAAFAFIATSQAREEIKVNQSYAFNYPLDTLRNRIFFHPNLENGLRYQWKELPPDSIQKRNELVERYLGFKSYKMTDTTCDVGIWMDIEIAGNKQKSGIWLNSLWHYCHGKSNEINPQLIRIFETTVLPYLKK